MPSIYGSLVTDAGLALDTAARLEGGDPVRFSTMVFGDGGGSTPVPSPTQTELVNEVFEIAVASVSVSSTDPNTIIIEAVIPMEVGGWSVREAGVKTIDGTLYAVAASPEIVKPTSSENALVALTVRMYIAAVSGLPFNLVVNPDIDYATKQWVIDNFEPKGSGGAFVPLTRILTAGPGLTGGGNLSQDRSFAADKPWFDARYADKDHLHDERYALLIHPHPIAIANGAAGFLSGPDKAKLDGLGAAGLRELAQGSGTNVNFIDLTLGPGPFDAIVWQIVWSPSLNNQSGVDYGVYPRGRIQNTGSGFPAVTPASYPIQLGLPVDGGGVLHPGNLTMQGAAVLFSNGLSIRHRSDYPPDFIAQAFTPPTTGQNRHMRIACMAGPGPAAVPFTASVKVWGF